MLQGDRLDLDLSLVNQLTSAATSSTHSIVTGGLFILITRSIGMEMNPDDRVPGSERLNLAAFEQMKFCKEKMSIFVGFTLGTISCLNLMSIEPLS